MASCTINNPVERSQDSIEDLMREGFQMAYFIIPNRSVALEVLQNALLKLQSERSREHRRTYWRDKYLKRRITRVVRDRADMLQWLIYLGTEPYEKSQETRETSSVRDMIVRFVKFLVQTSGSMSSFYAAIAIHRLLFNYTTLETQRVYEMLAHYYPGQQEYRRVKAILFKRVRERFAKCLHVCRTSHNELKFELARDQNSWTELVDVALRLFTPWSTRNICSNGSGANTKTGKLELPYLEQGLDNDSIDLQRAHFLIEPFCHGRVIKALGLDAREERLAIPMFFVNRSDSGGPSRSQDALPELTEDERSEILTALSRAKQRRQKAQPESIKIVVHGNELACLDVDPKNRCEFWIPEGAKLIEVWGEDQGAEILLGTHWVDYAHTQGIVSAKAIIRIADGKDLEFRIKPCISKSDEGKEYGASVFVTYQSAPSVAQVTGKAQPFYWIYKRPKYAFAMALLLLIGAGITFLLYRFERAENATSRTQIRQEGSVVYRLVPDDSRLRALGGSDEPVIFISGRSGLVVLELPVQYGTPESYHIRVRRFDDDKEIFAADATVAKDGHDGSFIVRANVPSTIFHSRNHYVLSLESLSSPGVVDQVETFTFSVK